MKWFFNKEINPQVLVILDDMFKDPNGWTMDEYRIHKKGVSIWIASGVSFLQPEHGGCWDLRDRKHFRKEFEKWCALKDKLRLEKNGKK